MRIAVARESDAAEPRVAATPETVKKMIGLGAEVAVEPGAGIKSGILDADYKDAGANVTPDALNGADIVLMVRRPDQATLSRIKKGAFVIAIMDPYGNDEALRAMADAGIDRLAMELLPRITRAQAMDVLSSQANLAGYRAVIDAAAEFGRALPDDDDRRRHRAAGPRLRHRRRRRRPAGDRHRPPARRHRLRHRRPARGQGADRVPRRHVRRCRRRGIQPPRPAPLRQGNERRVPAKQAELVAEHITKNDIIICTALMLGRQAPRLISQAMVDSMRPGTVIVDLAVERGGNCRGAEPGELVRARTA